jgi:hypothetical protein
LNDLTISAGHRFRLRTDIMLLAAAFFAEAIVFYVHVTRDVAPYYPPNFDQLTYYLITYDLIDAFHLRGFGAFVGELLQPANATGTTFDLQGALLSLIGGKNRTTLLSINLLYLLILQLVFFLVIRSRIERAAFAWIGIALLMSLATLFNSAGGVYDYRIDFSALSLYGIWICLIVWSGAFRHTGRTLVTSLICVWLIYARFFTIIYVGGVLSGLLVYNLYGIWRAASTNESAVAIRRARNVVLSGAIIAAICLPRLYLSRDAIYAYYMVGHVLGEEKFIRAHEMGLYSVTDHLFYYPKSLLKHVGVLTFLMAGALAGSSMWIDRLSVTELSERLHRFRQEFVALGLAVLIPIVVLTVNVSKSPVVGGIVVVPIVLAMILFGAAAWPRGGILQRDASWKVKLPAIVMTIALVAFAAKGLSSRSLAPRADLERISLLAQTIATYAKDNDLSRLTMSMDRVVDYQNIGTPRLYSIESLHRDLDIEPRFGHGAYGIFATSREDALRLFADSDVIVLTDPVTDRAYPYPMNTKIREYWDELWQWTKQNRVLIFSTDIFGIPYRVFARSFPDKPQAGGAPTSNTKPH